MCKHLRVARYRCFRLYGHTNIKLEEVDGKKHFYRQPAVEGDVPICRAYNALLDREDDNPPAPIAPQPSFIQRLKSRSRSAAVRFEERYEFDAMAAGIFHDGTWERTVTALDELSAQCRMEIGSLKISFVYNPRHYNEYGAVLTIRSIFNGRQEWDIPENPYFNSETCEHAVRTLKDRPYWNAAFPTALPHHHLDAWFDVQYGLFWTIDDINIHEIALNFERTVRAAELRRRRG